MLGTLLESPCKRGMSDNEQTGGHGSGSKESRKDDSLTQVPECFGRRAEALGNPVASFYGRRSINCLKSNGFS